MSQAVSTYWDVPLDSTTTWFFSIFSSKFYMLISEKEVLKALWLKLAIFCSTPPYPHLVPQYHPLLTLLVLPFSTYLSIFRRMCIPWALIHSNGTVVLHTDLLLGWISLVKHFYSLSCIPAFFSIDPKNTMILWFWLIFWINSFLLYHLLSSFNILLSLPTSFRNTINHP